VKVVVVVAGSAGLGSCLVSRHSWGCRPSGRASRRTRSPRWSTPVTTCGCTACGSALTWTVHVQPWAAAIDTDRGWARRAESWVVKEQLAAYGADPDWFGLGDKDIATHLVRSRIAARGLPAVGRHGGFVRPVAARRAAAADDRRPRREPMSSWTPLRVSARRSISRSGGCAIAPSCRATRSCRSAPRKRSRRPGAGRDQRGGRRAVRAVEPGGQCGHGPGCSRYADGMRKTDATVVGISPINQRETVARPWRTRA